ncbi:hypothetical protein LIER_25033 [Lithospermum erythrorhizon]|uniref:Reverse transcriptase domain-containing protein n=1 Tax=Lithospermum erythrorhizon TaxID=34254 RepID=A0AAV3R3D7_LITER
MIRRLRNLLIGLKNERGVCQDGQSNVQEVVLSYFDNIFRANDDSRPELTTHAMDSRVTERMNQQLTRVLTSEEVKHAVFDMSANKSTSPDSMTLYFFQCFWHIVSNDIVRAVDSFFFISHLLRSVNHTHACLIPKTLSPINLTELRPISLCNIVTKIIGNVMTNRMRPVLMAIISENKSAFLPGCMIPDNILIAREVLHFMNHSKSVRNTNMAIKHDMSKAYDRVEWKFLEALMLKLGFCCKWVDWTMSLVSTVSYSFLINGVPCGFIRPTRGIRQEELTCMMREAKERRTLTGIKISRDSSSINHILFADDTIIFYKATTSAGREITRILTEYEMASRKKVNVGKCSTSISPWTS